MLLGAWQWWLWEGLPTTAGLTRKKWEGLARSRVGVAGRVGVACRVGEGPRRERGGEVGVVLQHCMAVVVWGC